MIKITKYGGILNAERGTGGRWMGGGGINDPLQNFALNDIQLLILL